MQNKHAVIINGANTVGLAVATKLSQINQEIVITTTEDKLKNDCRFPVLMVPNKTFEKEQEKLDFLQGNVHTLVQIISCPDYEMLLKKRDIVSSTWPWISALQVLRQKALDHPINVLLVLTGRDPLISALLQTEMNYITADTIDSPVHINLLTTDQSYEDMEADNVEHVANATFILCSGLFAGMKAQTIHLNAGETPE